MIDALPSHRQVPPSPLLVDLLDVHGLTS